MIMEDGNEIIVKPELWVPDPKLITESEELRRNQEWLRKKSGYSGRKPTNLGIDSYRWSSKLHPKFFEGSNPPPVPLDSLENIEWYEEQLRRCVFGFEYKGQRITGDHYWFLNMFPFLVAKLDKKGHVTNEFDMGQPYYAGIHDYVFKTIEQAQYEGKTFLWMSGRGSGKEQPHYEKLMTPTGTTTMGEVCIGDTLLGRDGNHIKVTAKYPQGKKNIYRITLSDGRFVDCGLNHLWTVINNKHKKLTIELKDMLDSYQIKYKSGRIDSRYFIETASCVDYSYQELPIDPYILGVLLGDGGLTQRITFSSEDSFIVDILKEKLSPNYNINYLSGYDYSIVNAKHSKTNSLLNSIRTLGLNKKGDYKFIPKQYIFNSKENRLELLKGLLDTDGSITSGGYVEFYSISKQLIEDVAFLARSLGMKANVRPKNGRYKNRVHKSFRVSIFTDIPIFKLPRKLNNQIDSKYRKELREKSAIISIEKLPDKFECSCITVDSDDHLYLTRDFIPTHNTYIILSILAKIYHLKTKSHGIVSASNSAHATESFTKLLQSLDAMADKHPTLSLHRLQDTKTLIESGQEVVRDGIKYKEGPRSRLQKVIYGDNSGATRGSRPDAQLMEEVGDWATGKGDLKSCIGASIGSWRVGSINKCRVFMIGTGGSVASDQVKDVFNNPDAYNALVFKDFAPKSCFFLPAYYFLGGKGWEETSVNDNDSAKAFLEAERERTKDDMEIHDKIVQEFPFTIEEVFRKAGTNNFNQKHIAEQWTRLHYEWKDKRPERGNLVWIKSPGGSIKGVKWELNPNGTIEILEHPYRGPSGKEIFPDLYVGGVDSIDQGVADSTSIKNRSSLACLIKKRIIDGKYFKETSNLYVAKYIGRSLDVRWDYEETLKLTMYYNAKMNIEYTKIGIVNYFREAKQYHRLLKRPLVAMPSKGEKIAGLQKDQSNLIGTPASTGVIDHQDGKVKEYIEDYYSNIFFIDLLEQLRDYQREERRKYDLVIAMGLCELADEDMFGVAAKGEKSETSDFVLFGYYTDDHGIKRFGKLPGQAVNKAEKDNLIKPGQLSMATWIDISGKPRFDDNFEIGDADDLPPQPQEDSSQEQLEF